MKPTPVKTATPAPSEVTPVEPVVTVPDPVVAPEESAPQAGPAGSFALEKGREQRYVVEDAVPDATHAGATFTVPENLGESVLYNSVQVRSSDNGRSGYRSTVAMRPNGSLYLSIELLENGRRTILEERSVAPKGTFGPGDDVRLEMSYVNGTVKARAWSVSDVAPVGWQLAEKSNSSDVGDDDGVQLLSYLSRGSVAKASSDWSGLTTR